MSSMNEVSKLDCVSVRTAAFDRAGKIAERQKIFDTASTIKIAKELEKYFWGGMAPIEHAPTPLSTIEEAAEATKARLWELLNNTASPEVQKPLRVALQTWERFMAEVTAALATGPR